MARLVIGTNKTVGVPALVRDVAPALYREFQLDANGHLVPNTTTTHIMDFTGMTDVSAYALSNTYYNNTAISGAVDMSDLTTLSGNNACDSMFSGCTGITSADLSSLTTVSNNACRFMFQGCIGLTSVDLSSLTAVSGYGCDSMFSSCTGLTGVDLSALTTVSGTYACSGMFSGCTNITSLSFPSITPNSFGTRTNQFGSLCNIIPTITLHFPSNTQSIVETLSGYSTTAPFGAVSGSVLFDLPATYTLTGADSVTYTRNPKYDTATALAWKVGAYGTTNFTPAYYTSGTTDPTVGTTIYSDAACTTAITTVTAIA